MSRTFSANCSKKIVGSGIFHSSTPVASATRAFNASCGKTKSCTDIVKVTDNCSNKIYAYKVTRKFSPTIVNIGGTEVKFNYKTKAVSVDPSKVSSLRKSLSVKKSKKSKKSMIKKCIQKCEKM